MFGTVNVMNIIFGNRGGHDRNVTTSRTLQAMLDYIHMNGARRLVDHPGLWKWSSGMVCRTSAQRPEAGSDPMGLA
ncbi:MAG: hypothetical protein U0992_21905 [Planctomycetaceae bacterium]